MAWEWIVVLYAAYFAAVAFRRPYSTALRWAAFAALASTSVLFLLPSPVGTSQTIVRNGVPLLVLLAGYRLSGLFFVAPMASAERKLLAIDRHVFETVGWKTGARSSALRGTLELAYLLVYAMLPLGALALVRSGASDDLPTYWAVVLGACFASYAMLPWIQTRPPRAIEPPASAGGPATGAQPSGLRRLNLAILRSTSNQVNTVPSGHVAAAVAVALVVLSSAPRFGPAFVTLACAIALAAVAGRYHYTVDALAGAAVALVSWLCLGR
jgi:hypothetical protein